MRSAALFVLLFMGCARHAPAAPAAAHPLAAHLVGAALTPERAVRFRRIADLRLSPDGARLAAVVSEAKDAGTESHVWMADVRTGELRPFTSSPKSDRAPRWSPDGRTLAFLSSRSGTTQVHVMPVDGGESVALTSAVDDVSDFCWSPDGKRIAYLAHEAKKKDDPRLADPALDLERIFTIDLASKTARALPGFEVRYEEIAWPSADRLVVLATDRPRTEAWDRSIYAVALADGKHTVVARPHPPIEDVEPSPDGSRLAYVGTAREGPIPHDLFVVGRAQALTASLDRAVVDARWQDDATLVVRAVNGFENALYRVTEGSVSKVALPYSVRAFDVAKDGTIAFVGVGFDRLPELYVKPKNGPVRALGRVQDDAWRGVALANAEIFQTKSFDGTMIESALLKPAAPAGKAPLVLLVHGGPSSNYSADYFWFNAWAQLLVARGYEVLLPNPRGSTGYGEAFVMANRADWGGGDYRDIMAVLDGVLARGEADPQRLGIGGWSYGGEMTAWAIGHTTRFKAAVVGAGVFDQVAEFETEQEPAGDEWHFGTPWEHPDVFARNSPSTFIRNARTPTLIVHGDADRSNPLGQSQALYRALTHLGVESELVVYPGEPHGPRQAKHQIDIMERMLRWYDAHLR
jgi:dipeptidyl aminopeptidase/acylaminoacyl peptidase